MKFRNIISLLGGSAVAWLGVAGLKAAPLDPAIQSWVQAQTNFQTWSADVIQTRRLKTLTKPLKASGHVWFAAPDFFRWEIGNPARTIAVHQADQMLVIYPRLKRVERYPLNGGAPGQWKETLALLDAGFPRSTDELESKFRILSLRKTNDVYEVELEPKAASAREMMPQIDVGFSSDHYRLRNTVLHFADGSEMRNDFLEPKVDPELPKDIFKPEIPPGFSVVEPLKK